MPRRMALPKNIHWVTFDVYGTLIDWESGVFDAFQREATRDGFTIEDRRRSSRFHEYDAEIEGGSYELYAEVLRRAAVRIAKEIGWPLEPSRAGFLPDSVARWAPFKETNPQLTKFSKKFQTGLISNIDDKLLGQTRRHLPHDFDLVVTAQQVRSYKPDPAHFKECARRIGGKKGWVHIAASYYHDVEPCLKEKVPVIWVNRREEARPGPRSRRPRSRPSSKRPSCSGGVGQRAVRVVSLHPDVLVAPASVADDLHALRSGEEGFVVDSPIFPDELEALPARARAGRLPGSAACSRPTATGTTCSAGSPSPAPRSAWPRRPRRG